MKSLEDVRNDFKNLNVEFLRNASAIGTLDSSELLGKAQNFGSACESLRSNAEELIEPARAAVLPLLTDKIRSPWDAAQKALNVGELGLGVLCGALREPDAEVRARAARSLGFTYSQHPFVVWSLCNALGDADVYVRSEAAGALGELGPMAKEAVPGLIRAVSNMGSERGMRNATWALARIGQDAAPAIPTLLELRDRTSIAGVEAICIALAMIDQQYELIVPALLFESFWPSRRCAAWALGKVGAKITAAAPAAASALSVDDTVAKTKLVEQLRQMDFSRATPSLALIPPDERFTSPLGLKLITARLREMMQTNDKVLRGQAASALRDLGEDVEISDDFCDALLNPNCRSCLHDVFLAIDALAELRDPPDGAKDLLRKELQDSCDSLTRARAAAAVGKWGNGSRDIQLLSNLLERNHHPLVRAEIERSLDALKG